MTDRELYEMDKTVIGREMTREVLELFMKTIHERGFITDEQYGRFNGKDKEDREWMIQICTFANNLYLIRTKQVVFRQGSSRSSTCRPDEMICNL